MAIVLDSNDFQLLLQGTLDHPHRLLGLHETPRGPLICLWRPGAAEIYLEVLGEIVQAKQVDEKGLFEYLLPKKIKPTDYRIYHQNGALAHDAYAFLPEIGELDTSLFEKGLNYDLYSVLGAQIKQVEGVAGVQFAVWAPNGRSVSLIGDFNAWDGRLSPMRRLGSTGIWQLFVPGIGQGEKYKFEIHTKTGDLRIKSDPLAFYSELRPRTASIVFDINAYAWTDQKWIESRAIQTLNRPINIYEVHLGSWRRPGAEFPTFRQLALDLAKYCLEMSFTHIELMPVMEHPLDESWGYQVTGFFSASSRYGTPTDFQYFVDYMHKEGIGVILDWVPAHFPTDDFSLNRFDGTSLYEHEDPRKGMHPHWQTAIFNYERPQVCNFLIASALFWFDKMHIDGLRVDAVASMLYLDYGRKAGEWLPNPDGSNYNIAAIEFIKHLNTIAHARFAGIWMIAEESSSYTGVTQPTEQGGLGFDLKWNMGWMNDTLRYFSEDPIYRKFHQNDLTFSLLYAFSEKFMLVLSHDEVVHGKGSLLNKMPGTYLQKFANLRLLYTYLICQPGKKLLFMGGELGQLSEWDSSGQIDWPLLQSSLHQGLSQMVSDLNHFYLCNDALWEYDFEWRGFEWIDFSDHVQSVLSYLRKGKDSILAIVHHFNPQPITDYWIPLASIRKIEEIFNSDSEKYGGSGKVSGGVSITKDPNGISSGFTISLLPMATLIFKVEFESPAIH